MRVKSVVRFIEPVKSFLDLDELTAKVNSMQISEVIEKVQTRKNIYILGSRLEKIKTELGLPADVLMIECYRIDSNIILPSLTNYFEECQYKFMAMVKLGYIIRDLFALSDGVYIAKLLDEKSLRYLALGKIIHDIYLSTLENILSNYYFVSEVEFEKNLTLKTNGKRSIHLRVEGRCDGLLVNDHLYVVELKLKYRDHHRLQHSLYGLCLGADRLLAVDTHEVRLVEPYSREELTKKLLQMYKIINVEKININIKADVEKCRRCLYMKLCDRFKYKLDLFSNS